MALGPNTFWVSIRHVDVLPGKVWTKSALGPVAPPTVGMEMEIHSFKNIVICLLILSKHDFEISNKQ